MSFQPSITLSGIEEAVHGLGYRNESALKYRLVSAIRERYGTNGKFSEPVHGIDGQELICLLWSVDPDPDSLRSKKKNLSSIKSSVNADLKRLYREGKNPEGIMIGPENLFTISDEAKDDLLASIRTGGAAELQEIKKVAEILNGILSRDGIAKESHKEEMGSDLQQIGNLLRSLSEKMGLQGDAGPMQKGIEEFLKDVELGTDEGESFESIEALGEPEGEFPEADHDDLVTEEDQSPDYEEIVIDDTVDLTEVSEGEVYEALEEVDEEESLEEVDDSEISEIFSEGDLEVDASGDLSGAIGTGEGSEQEGVSGDVVEPLEIEEELEEVAEEAAEEYEDSEDVYVEAPAEEGEASQDSEEIPDTIAAAEGVIEEGAPEEVVDALELEEDLGDLEEETPEEYDESDDIVLDAGIGESAPLDGEEEGFGGEVQNAPVQGMSVGDEIGGTEKTEGGKARILAEKFNSSLSEMDRFYNQYLFVPAGEYTIGSPDPREKWNPARRVHIAEFYIGKFPVTNALFDVFVEKTGYRTTAERVGYGIVYYGRFQKKLNAKTGRETVIWNSSLTSKIVQGAFWYQPCGPGSNLHHKRNHPVVQISLEDAMAFAAWTGKRLPTEEEWEAASRTMKGGLYPWGNRPRKDACNMEKSGHGDTTPVDQFLKFENENGVADTLGNVLEWTTTKTDAQGDGERAMVCFIAKGGSWITARPLTLAGREECVPELHSNILGFRCVAY